jgi:hypothetical protein
MCPSLPAVGREVLQAFSISSREFRFSIICYRACPRSANEAVDETNASEKRRNSGLQIGERLELPEERFAIANEFGHRQPNEMPTTLRRCEGEKTDQCLRGCG